MPLPLRWRYRLNRWRASLAGVFHSQSQPARPRLCPSCGALVGSSASKCHECGASMNFSLAAASRSLSSLLPAESPVTYIILSVNFILFALCLVASAQGPRGFSLFGGIRTDILYRLGARDAYAILVQHELWRLVMPIFLHGGLFHIGMNTLVFMDLGPQLEELYGSARYFFLYIATGVASFLASTAWNLFFHGGHGISIGASGALTGLIGLMLAITTRRGGAYAQMIRSQLLRWVGYMAVLGLLLPGIDNGAHFGGLVTGFLLGRVFADREPMNATERKRAYALGWTAGLVLLASFAAMLMQYFRNG